MYETWLLGEISGFEQTVNSNAFELKGIAL
jgi:hypothetical protein